MKRYRVLVQVRDGDVLFWRPIHPVGGEPYVFTREEAEQVVRTYSGTSAYYRMEEVK